MDERMMLRHADHVVSQRAAEETVLLSLHNGQYYALSDVSGRVWDLCTRGTTLGDLVTAIHAEYDAPVEMIRADVVHFVGEMLDEELLVADGVAPAE